MSSLRPPSSPLVMCGGTRADEMSGLCKRAEVSASSEKALEALRFTSLQKIYCRGLNKMHSMVPKIATRSCRSK